MPMPAAVAQFTAVANMMGNVDVWKHTRRPRERSLTKSILLWFLSVSQQGDSSSKLCSFLTVLFVFPILPPSLSPLHAVVSLFPPPGAPQQLAGTKSALLLCPGCLRSWANLFFRIQELSSPQQSLRFVFFFSLPELPAAIIVGFVFLQGLRSWSAFGFLPCGQQ